MLSIQLSEGQQRLFLLLSGLFLLAGMKEYFAWQEWHWGFLFLLIALLGLPHGALDHHVGRFWLEPIQGRIWPLSFGFFYLGLLGLVLACWIQWPELLLSLFLLLSVLHFGQEDTAALSLGERLYWTHVVFRGLLPLCAPAFFATETTGQLLAPLLLQRGLAEHAHDMSVFGATLFVPLCLLGFLIYACWWKIGGPLGKIIEQIAESILIVLCFVLLSPLEGFVLDFCLHHSLRHSQEMAHWLFPTESKPLRRFWKQARPLSLAAIVMALFTWFWLPNRALEWGGLQVIFIGLAALTLPHVVLHWLVFDLRRPLPVFSTPEREFSWNHISR